jgi:hypothetical protein
LGEFWGLTERLIEHNMDIYMHLRVCVWSLLRGVVFGEMDQPAGFFMLRFYFKTFLTLLLSNLFCQFHSHIIIFLYFGWT